MIQHESRRPRLLTAVIPILAAAALSCAPDADMDGEAGRWTVASDPETVIGQMEGDSVYLFQRIREARMLPDDRIVVADQGLSVLRIYDIDGTFLTQMGRKGEGPGEFESLSEMWIKAPDTIGVWDRGTLRLTFFASDGSLARTVGLEPSVESAGVGHLDFLVGQLHDGSIALGSLTVDSDGRDRISVERFGPEGAHLERVTEVKGFIRGASGPGPFSPYPYFDVRGDAIYFTNGETPTVRVWERGASGTAEWVNRPISFPRAENDPAAAWDAVRPILEARNDRLQLSFLERAEPPDSIPHLAGLLVDDRGRIWTKSYEAPYDAMWIDGGSRVRGGEWWVTDPGGRLVATASVPDGVIPLQVEGDRLLALTVDRLGIERVQVHRIDRSTQD